MTEIEPIHAGRRAPALLRGLDILEFVLQADEAMSATQIADDLSLPRTTAHELLMTLVSRGYLTARTSDVRRFELGPTLLQLGHKYQSGVSLITEGEVIAERVSRESGETVHLAVLEGVEVLYLLKIDTPQTVRMVSRIGARLPAHATSVGKMLLASLPLDVLETRVPRSRPLAALTSATIVDHDVLRSELDRIRAQGFATEERESNTDVSCVAAPVRDHTGQVVAAMSVSVPTSRHTPERLVQWTEEVRAGAEDLSRRMGHFTTAQHSIAERTS